MSHLALKTPISILPGVASCFTGGKGRTVRLRKKGHQRAEHLPGQSARVRFQTPKGSQGDFFALANFTFPTEKDTFNFNEQTFKGCMYSKCHILFQIFVFFSATSDLLEELHAPSRGCPRRLVLVDPVGTSPRDWPSCGGAGEARSAVGNRDGSGEEDEDELESLELLGGGLIYA